VSDLERGSTTAVQVSGEPTRAETDKAIAEEVVRIHSNPTHFLCFLQLSLGPSALGEHNGTVALRRHCTPDQGGRSGTETKP
jgi:hypothetical protein